MKTKLTRKVVLIIATTLTALAMLTACDNEDISSYENTVKDTDTAKATSVFVNRKLGQKTIQF